MKCQRAGWLTALFLFLFLGTASLFAYDFGLSLSATPKYLGEDFTLNASASPWFSQLLNEQTDIYVSALVDYELLDEKGDVRFDLGRTQVSYRAKPGMTLDAGRLFYADIAGLVGDSLFDGARASLDFPFGRGVFAAYYSGFLNKERAALSLSASDLSDSTDDDVYFAPSRIFASVAFSSPSLFGKFGLNSEILSQFDLRGTSKLLHSQYLILSSSFPLAQDLSLSLGFVASLVESKADESSIDFGASARGEVSWFVPSPLFDKLYLGGAWGSGLDGDLGAFLPITGPDAGKVFDVPLIGVATIHAGYFIKLMPQLSADVSLTSFIRQGAGVYDDEINLADDSAYLGTEAYASILLSVSSELSISMGTGLFFPSTDAFVEDTKNRFMITATAIVSF